MRSRLDHSRPAARLMVLLGTALVSFQADAIDPGPPLFDTAHVEGAIAYLSKPSEEALDRVADTAAAQHLLEHAEVTGYYPAGSTRLDITRDLLSDPVDKKEVERVERMLALLRGEHDRQRACQADALTHLPVGFRFPEPIYVTWGYDIGVAMNGSASINLVHPRFAADAEEIWFYCTHEMHHAGFTHFRPFPTKISEIETAEQMLDFIRYATMLEGMAVHAAWTPRQRADALDADPDYVALLDPARMVALEKTYWEIYDHFRLAGDRTLAEEDWLLVEQLSDNDRLWYRVGALMAARIEASIGPAAYRELPRVGPDAFFSHYLRAGDSPI